MDEDSHMNIIEFLEARIAEDEADNEDYAKLEDDDARGWAIAYAQRVLAECAAKRAIIAAQYWTPQSQPTDKELHTAARHPSYEYETTEGQRKRWDDADEPPEGAGWERNIERGRDGWDRFDYTEESYWRRLKPESERKPWKQYIPKELRALASVYKDHPDYQQEWEV